MKRAIFDDSGFPLAFYDPEIHGDGIPAGTTEISAHPGLRRFVSGEVVVVDPPQPNERIGDISDRQFAQGLAELGLIAEDEAEEWVAAGTLPPALLALVDQLPAEQRFPARMLLRGATRFEFGHPLAEAFANLASPPWTTEARAAFWRHCATL